MKIYFSPASPFVRKCMVIAHELGLADRIEKLPSAAGPWPATRTSSRTIRWARCRR